MIKFGRFPTILPVVFLVYVLMGCAADIDISSLPIVTPAPVTPIVPPEGIRGTLILDPRTPFEPPFAQSIAPHVNQAGLGVCFSNSGQVVEAEAVNVNTFWAGIYVQVCGWHRSGLPIDVSVTLPNGTVIEETVETRSIPDKSMILASYRFSAQEPDLFGMYQFTFSDRGASLPSDDGVFSIEYEVILPMEPRIYVFQDGSAWLHNFDSSETVQMLRYDVSDRAYVEWETGVGISETYTLVDQQMITIGDDGTKALFGFSAEPDGPYGHISQLVAIGSVSGEISTPFRTFTEKSVLLDP